MLRPPPRARNKAPSHVETTRMAGRLRFDKSLLNRDGSRILEDAATPLPRAVLQGAVAVYQQYLPMAMQIPDDQAVPYR